MPLLQFSTLDMRVLNEHKFNVTMSKKWRQERNGGESIKDL